MKIVVGLGNPQEKYAGTRHNLGFLVLDELRRKINAPEWSLEGKFKTELSEVNPDLILARPQTFMNKSGLAILKLSQYYQIAPQDIIVVHDDLDLMLGKIKVRIGGGFGGHHGVESVVNELGTDQFIRVRLGIGNLRSHSGEHNRISFNAEKFVLQPFVPNERSRLKRLIKDAIKAVELVLDKGLDTAQNQFN